MTNNSLIERYPEYIKISERINQLVLRHSARQIPEVLYHYTPFSSFNKIINDRTLLFTESQDLNDRKELSHSTEYLINEIKKSETLSPYHEFIEELDEMYRDRNKFYLSCMSVTSDNLAMWRMYADDAYGVVIGFDKNMFGEGDQNGMPVIAKVRYGDSFTKKVVDSLIEPCEKIVKVEEGNIPLLREALLCLINPIYTLALVNKHKSFNVEQEIRFLHMFKNGQKPREFVTEKPVITAKTYLTINENAISQGLSDVFLENEIIKKPPSQIKSIQFPHNAIKEVFVGCRHDDSEVNKVVELLKHYQYDTNEITIQKFTSTYG